MDDGSKKKRFGLSLKTSKKSAANKTKSHLFSQRSSKLKPDKRVVENQQLNLSKQEGILATATTGSGTGFSTVTAISGARMKLLDLMPSFPDWERMQPLPISQLIESLINPKVHSVESSDENNKKNCEPNNSGTKTLGGNVCEDLPKIGIERLLRKLREPLITFENCNKHDLQTNSPKPLGTLELDLKENEDKNCEENNRMDIIDRRQSSIIQAQINSRHTDTREGVSCQNEDVPGDRLSSAYGARSEERRNLSHANGKSNTSTQVRVILLDEDEAVVGGINFGGSELGSVELSSKSEGKVPSRNPEKNHRGQRPPNAIISGKLSRGKTDDINCKVDSLCCKGNGSPKSPLVIEISDCEEEEFEYNNEISFQNAQLLDKITERGNWKYKGENSCREKFEDNEQRMSGRSIADSTCKKRGTDNWRNITKKSNESLHEHTCSLGGENMASENDVSESTEKKSSIGHERERNTFVSVGKCSYTDSGSFCVREGNVELQKIDEDLFKEDGLDDLMCNLGDDLDDEELVSWCDGLMSPTIPVRENTSLLVQRDSVKENIGGTACSRGAKRRLEVSEGGQSKMRRSSYKSTTFYREKQPALSPQSTFQRKNDEEASRLDQCPICQEHFWSGLSKQEIDEHIGRCFGSDGMMNEDDELF